MALWPVDLAAPVDTSKSAFDFLGYRAFGNCVALSHLACSRNRLEAWRYLYAACNAFEECVKLEIPRWLHFSLRERVIGSPLPVGLRKGHRASVGKGGYPSSCPYALPPESHRFSGYCTCLKSASPPVHVWLHGKMPLSWLKSKKGLHTLPQ